MLSRARAAERLGVSIHTFRRRIEKELPPAMAHPDRGHPLWDPEVIEEYRREEQPPLSPEEQAAANIRAFGEVAEESLRAGVDALVKTGEIQQAALGALKEENEELRKDRARLSDELAGMRKQHQEWLDELYRRNREDKEGDLRLRQREEWHRQGVRTLGHLAPAGLALVGKAIGFELPAAASDAVTSIFAGMPKERFDVLRAEIAESKALTAEEKISLSMAVQATTTTTPNGGASSAPRSLAEREADIKARFEAIAAEAAALADEREKEGAKA
jgi:hypothetical protein